MLTDGTTGLDQAIPKSLVIRDGVMQDKYEEDYVLELADRVLGHALEDGDFNIAFLAIEKFRSMNKASSLGTCKLLHGIKAHWNEIDSEGETFVEAAMRKTGYARLTIERYVSVWELLTGEYIPEEFRENVWGQTMRCLVKEASLVVDQGYELEDEDWLALSEAVDEHSIADVVSKVKGKERNKNHLSLKIDERGNISAFQNNIERQIGKLYLDESDPVVTKAIKRICDSSGITRKNEY